MKKFSVEYSQIIDDEYISLSRTFSSFSSLRDYILSEFSISGEVEDFQVRTLDTEYISTLPKLF